MVAFRTFTWYNSTMTMRQPIRSKAADQRAISRVASLLSDQAPAVSALVLLGADESRAELPAPLYEALRDATEILLRGDAVSIAPIQKELTTTEAASLLGLSRQFLTRLVNRGDIRCRLVGRHRRLRLRDVLEYQRRRDASRSKAVADLTAQSVSLGVYD